jgi:hypothetical protein
MSVGLSYVEHARSAPKNGNSTCSSRYKKSACFFECGKQARRSARKFQVEGAYLRVEQFSHRDPVVDRSNTVMFGIGLGWELEVRWKPIHLVFTAIGTVQEVLDDAFLHRGVLTLVTIGNHK